MCAPLCLRRQVASIRSRQVYAGRHAGGDRHSEPSELLRLVRIVAEQRDSGLPQRMQHLRSD